MRTHEQTEFTRLLEDYCRLIGMSDFEIEPEGGVIEFGDVTIILRHDGDFERVSMVAPIGEVEVEGLARVAPQLLQLNVGLAVSGGQAFCADIETGEVSLQQSLPLKNFAAEDFDGYLSALAEKTRAARALIGKLEELAALESAAGEETRPEPEPSDLLFRL
jgi:hypothetical protein